MFAATGTLLKTVKEFENDWKVRCGTVGARLLLCDRGGMWESDLGSTGGAILRQSGWPGPRGRKGAGGC